MDSPVHEGETAHVRQLDPLDVKALMQSAAPPLIVDVREAQEYRGELGHIAGSLLVPLRELPARMEVLEPYREREVVAVCRAGVRSQNAAALLAQKGFRHVANLRGGLLAWKDKELPLEH